MKDKSYERMRIFLLVILIIACGFFLLSPAEGFADASGGESGENGEMVIKAGSAQELSSAFKDISNPNGQYSAYTKFRIVLTGDISNFRGATLSRNGTVVTLVGNGYKINMAQGEQSVGFTLNKNSGTTLTLGDGASKLTLSGSGKPVSGNPAKERSLQTMQKYPEAECLV
ncbi:MAG: hypothetical protein ACI4W2_11910 [Eubacterium sp.]